MSHKNGVTKAYEVDSHAILTSAYMDGRTKYESGHQEHKSKFWTAGLAWYASNLRDEILDGVAYVHHLTLRIGTLLEIAEMLEKKKITSKQGAKMIREIVSAKPIDEDY